MPRFSVIHTTRYSHHSVASASWQALHLQPRNEQWQHCESFELQVAPHPNDLTSRFDYFGNKQHLFTLREPHRELVITSRSIVRRDEPSLPMPGLTPSLFEIPSLVQQAVAETDFTLQQYLHPTSLVPFIAEARALTDELAGGMSTETPLMDWISHVGRRFTEAFTFDREATGITTPISDVIVERRGVCQDFTHLLLSCLRQMRIPAAYVSGYLLTRPPEGQPRLVGADASHAWVSAYVPGTGWVDYDPTNACFAGAGHIVAARGRDFSDVSPVKGLFSGGGDHSLLTGVTVEEVD
jgi:transglutaminase-like putative cysteine protease